MDSVKVSICRTSTALWQITNKKQDAVNTVILNPDLAPLLAVLKSARNGAVYGAKVRFPHALVYVLPRDHIIDAHP